MTLEYKLETLDGVDTSLAALYTENSDGDFVLDVGGLPAADTEKGNKALDVERKAAREARAASKEAKALSKKYTGLGKSPEEIAEILEAHEAALEAAAKKRGDFDAIRKQDQEKFEAERSAWSEERATLTKSERDAIVQNQLVTALAAAGFTQSGIDILPNLVAKRIKIETEDGSRVTTILQQDGATPLAGSAENGTATFADLAKELAVKYPELAMSSHKGGGATPPSGKSTTDAKTITREAFNEMGQSARAEHFKSGGQVINTA